MDKVKIERINELAKRSRTASGLTPEEMTEQADLRKEYIESVKANFRRTLENIEFDSEGNKKDERIN